MARSPPAEQPLGAPSWTGLPSLATSCETRAVAIFKARSPDDLTILRAGMCPDCGAGVYQGLQACGACGLSFQNNLGDLPQRKAPAAAPQAQAPTPSPYSAPPGAPTVAAVPAAPVGYAPPVAPPAQGGRPPPPPSATTDNPMTFGKPLDLDTIMEFERGPLALNHQPLTDAEAPDVASGNPAPLMGSALSRAAIVVMADAAVCDDPMVLLGYPAQESHVARAMINLRRGESPIIDDPEILIAARDVTDPTQAQPRKGPSQDAAVPDRQNQAPQGGLFTGPGIGKPLTLEDIERLERPWELEQPHSFAEVCDLEGGVGDPKLGAAVIRGSTVTMAEACVTDDPLVLLGYPPLVPRDVARAMINLKRADAGNVDSVESLLQRTAAPAPAAAPPRAAPHAAAPAVAAGRAPDPDATALLDQAAVRAAQAAVAREQANPNRVASRVHGSGGVQSID